MISFIVRMRFGPENREEVAAALRELAAASRKEPGCVTYVPHQVESDPDTVVIYEQYTGPEALEAHRASEHFQRLAAGVLSPRARERSVENLNALL